MPFRISEFFERFKQKPFQTYEAKAEQLTKKGGFASLFIGVNGK